MIVNGCINARLPLIRNFCLPSPLEIPAEMPRMKEATIHFIAGGAFNTKIQFFTGENFINENVFLKKKPTKKKH